MNNAVVARAGVIGWPIAHSRSPIIHHHWLRELGIVGSYERFPVEPKNLGAFTASIGQAGLLGANVTAPHKEAAYALCDRRTPVAEAMGAVNTLWRDGAELWGDNTDVAGFLANMDDDAPGWAAGAKSAIVIGAGGAARAVIYALISRHIAHIAVFNRTEARADALAAKFGATTEALPWSCLAAQLRGADLLVNSSSLGMAGQPPLSIDLSALPGGATVADVVYVPLRTPLIEAAKARGLRTVEGLGMLLHQAAPAFERWFGRRPEVTPALRALVEADVLVPRQENR
jgi:shikimate dehydrogenase